MKKYSYVWGLAVAAVGAVLTVLSLAGVLNLTGAIIAATVLAIGLILCVCLLVFVSGRKYASPTKTFIKYSLVLQAVVSLIPIVDFTPVIISGIFILVLSVSTGMVQHKFGMPCEFLPKMLCAAAAFLLSFPLHIYALALIL